MNETPEPLRQCLESSDPVVARAAALVSSVDPLPLSNARRRRVRRGLDERRRGAGRALLRPAVVVGVLLGLTAAATATWGTVRALQSSAPEDVSVPVAPAPVVDPPKRSSPVVASAPAVAVEAEPEPEPADEAPKPASRPRVSKPGSEAALVQGAVSALRRDGDPEKATRLLDEYRKRNPGGALSEEALALAVEAAVARKDPRAQDLARQYLAKYPGGRFSAVARRAVSSAESR